MNDNYFLELLLKNYILCFNYLPTNNIPKEETMKKFLSFRKMTFAMILLSFITTGCAGQKSKDITAAPAAATKAVEKQQAASYKGTISGVSEKAKTIAIQVGPEGKTETMMLMFDDKTSGMDFAKKGDSVTITYEMRDKDAVALSVKPNLAKLPEGVTEIKTAELQTLLDKNANLLVIDARPESRYAQSHLPGAVSISVEKMAKEMGAVLPKDKEQMLVFYCGGPT